MATNYYGDYDGFASPNAARSAEYTEEFIWSSASQFWDIRQSYVAGRQPIGPGEYTDDDVGQVLLRKSDIQAYDRSGVPITQPDTTFPLEATGEQGATYNRQPTTPMMLPSLSRAATAVAISSIPPQRRKQTLGDRRMVTAAAAIRNLDDLATSATEIGRSAAGRLFEIKRGDFLLRLTFDDRVGAVTRTVSTDSRGVVAESEFFFRRDGAVFVLDEERTSVKHPGGRTERIVRRYSNHTVR
ncbi:MAG: hypothetical protein ABIV11_06520 [Gemmatimonadaceae bacterium]